MAHCNILWSLINGKGETHTSTKPQWQSWPRASKLSCYRQKLSWGVGLQGARDGIIHNVSARDLLQVWSCTLRLVYMHTSAHDILNIDCLSTRCSFCFHHAGRGFKCLVCRHLYWYTQYNNAYHYTPPEMTALQICYTTMSGDGVAMYLYPVGQSPWACDRQLEGSQPS